MKLKKYIYISIFIFSCWYIHTNNTVFAEGDSHSCIPSDTMPCSGSGSVNVGNITQDPSSSAGGNHDYVPEIDDVLGVDKNIINGPTYEGEMTCANFKLPTVGKSNYSLNKSGLSAGLISQMDNTSFMSKLLVNGNYCDGNSSSPTYPPNQKGTCPIPEANYGKNVTISSSVKRDEDYTRNPHQWLWKTYKCEEGDWNGKGEGYEGKLHCTKEYEKFPGLSNEFIQKEIIDKGYLDYMLEEENAKRISQGKSPDNRPITERRKDIQASAFKSEIFEPVTYYQNGKWNTYKDVHSPSSSYTMLFEPFYWYQLDSYAQWHYKYTASTSFKWYQVVSGTKHNSKDFSVFDHYGWHYANSPLVVQKMKELDIPVNATVTKIRATYQTVVKEQCKDAPTGSDWKCDNWYDWTTYFNAKWDVTYSALTGPFSHTYLTVDQTEETTDFMFVNTQHDYEGVAELINNPIEHVCKYIPPEVTAKKCRAYYRGDGGISNSDKQMFEQKCPCVELSNLTD